jgi:hypothetical protein
MYVLLEIKTIEGEREQYTGMTALHRFHYSVTK